MTAVGFVLDERLQRDTLAVADLALSRLLLMDDARYPWLVLVPRRAGASELTTLAVGDQALLLAEINRAAAALTEVGPFDKLNIASLGNVVAQLHVHVVGRRPGDAAWPGPVWGHGPAQRYSDDEAERRVAALRRFLGDAAAIPANH